MRDLRHVVSTYLPSAVAYLFVGGSAALVEWAVFLAFTSGLDQHYIAGMFAGFVVATTVNFFLSARLVFRSSGRSPREELALVFGVSAIGFVINLSATAALIEFAGADEFAAKVAGTGTAFLANYTGRQFFVFDQKRHRLERLSAFTARRLMGGFIAKD